jgi:hypothetical protein
MTGYRYEQYRAWLEKVQRQSDFETDIDIHILEYALQYHRGPIATLVKDIPSDLH